jgi:arginine/ornithine N-succinyltransferase beta subunit
MAVSIESSSYWFNYKANGMVHLEPEMDERDQQKVVLDYANYVGKALTVCLVLEVENRSWKGF